MAGSDRIPINISFRVGVAMGIAAVLFFILGLRVWFLQVVYEDEYKARAENNRQRIINLPPPRGVIRDRNGVILVKNRPSFDIELVEEDAPDPLVSINKLSLILGENPEKLLVRSRDQKKRRRFEPKLLFKDVSRDVVAKVAAHQYDLPGIVINVHPLRDYLHGDLASHVVGYIREITPKQLEGKRFRGGYPYMQGDIVGQYGVEDRLEWMLQGQRGERKVFVNSHGIRMNEAPNEKNKKVHPGQEVTLTIDYDVQKAADEVLKDKKGAIVAMDPFSGEILALASAPRFDPNIFTSDLDIAQWKDLVEGKDKKLNNRAVQGSYSPGSTFKIFMAVAALAEGVMGKNDKVNCSGGYFFANRVFHCHKRTGHGAVDLKRALTVSCNTYFYIVGQRLGIERIHKWATFFGLGEKTDLDLVDENSGTIPSEAWKKKRFAKRSTSEQKWYPGETLSVVIGQGDVAATPLQMARAVSVLVNGGFKVRPTLVRSGEVEDKMSRVKSLDVEPWIIQKVREGLVSVVNEPGGTARRAKMPEDLPVIVAGKTGTSQLVSLSHKTKNQELKDHGWFVGYAPADKPEIVVAALYENGGSGGAATAPLVKEVMETYFRKKLGIPKPLVTPTPVPTIVKKAKATPVPTSVPVPSTPTPVAVPQPQGGVE